MWQRCWAPVDKKSLTVGAFFGTIAVMVVVFFFGFLGLMAAWGGVWSPSGPDDYGTTILFSLISKKWMLVILSILSVTMTESAVDSLQNGLANTMSTVFVFPYFGSIHTNYIRLIVLALNVVPVIISLKRYYIIQLFLLANLITTTSLVPLLMGIIPGKRVQKIVTPFSFLSGCGVGFSSLLIWAKIDEKLGESYRDALRRTFLEAYVREPFLLALGFSIVGMMVGGGLEFLVRMCVKEWREYPLYDLSQPVGFYMGELETKVTGGDREKQKESINDKENDTSKS